MTASTDRPLVSVVVPVRNDEAGLVRTLAALENQDYPREAMDVLVVDNGSSRPLYDLARSWPWVRFTEETSPGSYRARNRALAMARGDVIAFTDADCEPEPLWLAAGVGALLADEGVGLVAGAVRVVPRHDGRRRSVELWEMLHAFPQQTYVESMGWGVTANLFTRASVLAKVGHFNPELISGGDKEWGMRVHAAGFRVAYVADAVVVHPPRETWREHYAKLRRVYAGELAARIQRGEPTGDVGRVTPRRVAPPLSALRRAPVDNRLQGVGQRLRYAGGAIAARYLGVWAGARARATAGSRTGSRGVGR